MACKSPTVFMYFICHIVLGTRYLVCTTSAQTFVNLFKMVENKAVKKILHSVFLSFYACTFMHFQEKRYVPRFCPLLLTFVFLFLNCVYS